MIGISKLYMGQAEASDPLRYGRKSAHLPSHLLQFSADKKPIVVWNITQRCNLKCRHCYAAGVPDTSRELSTAEALREALDDSIELLGPNSMYVVRIDGYFNRVAARTELYQHEPYKPFAKVLETDERRFAFENIEGSLVCFYFPPFMDGVNTPGWHFHFINAARTLGGHVFDVDMVRGTATLNKTDRFILDLPSNQAFQYADLANASKEDIHKVEQGGGD